MRTALIAVLLSISAVAQSYAPAPGPYKVMTVDYVTLHDEARLKDIPLKIYYPDGHGPFPVIVFSHGLYGSRLAYSQWGEFWASQGYVSIHLSHDDSTHDNAYRKPLREAMSDSDLWQSRPQDISFVISSFADLERQKALDGKLDSSRVGVAGHSYGAYTAEAIAGALVQMPGSPQPRSFADKRVKAVIAMSPQGEGEMGLTRASWAGIHVPVLTMYGSLDFGSQRRTPDWRSQPFTYSSAGDKYDVEIQGATHMTFVGRAQAARPRRFGKRRAQSPAGASQSKEEKLFGCAESESLAFFDAYLKGDPAAKQFLATDQNPACAGIARIAHK